MLGQHVDKSRVSRQANLEEQVREALGLVGVNEIARDLLGALHVELLHECGGEVLFEQGEQVLGVAEDGLEEGVVGILAHLAILWARLPGRGRRA